MSTNKCLSLRESGICGLRSSSEVNEYCVMGPCPMEHEQVSVNEVYAVAVGKDDFYKVLSVFSNRELAAKYCEFFKFTMIDSVLNEENEDNYIRVIPFCFYETVPNIS